jgi:hypothetical protein
MLQILSTSTIDAADLRNRAALCLDAWKTQIEPQIKELVNMLPSCLLPGPLLQDWFQQRAIDQVNAYVLEIPLFGQFTLSEVSGQIQSLAQLATETLVTFATMPYDEQRRAAYDRVVSFRTLLHELPRNILLP